MSLNLLQNVLRLCLSMCISPILLIGFMYLRYTQPPADLYDWYEDYLQDEEEIDVKAGGGQVSRLYDYIFYILV